MTASPWSVRRGLVLAAVLVAGAVATVHVLQPSSGATAAVGQRGAPLRAARWGADQLPGPATPAFTVPTPHPLRIPVTVSRWAPVAHPAAARVRPSSSAAVVTTLSTRTPEGTANLVLVVGVRHTRPGGLWAHVRLPILPNNTEGWVKRSALGGYRFVRTRLVVDLRTLRATLYRGRRIVFRAPVGVGRASTPTPQGHFYIRDRLTRYASPFYGPIAFGTSARSAAVTDWPDGGFVGIHGTDQPGLIPGRVSHGCIRMRNSDIRRLARLMPIGSPLIVR